MRWRVGLAPPIVAAVLLVAAGDQPVLVLLARGADPDGWCRGSHADIARALGVCRRTVIRALLRLEALGRVASWAQTRADGGKDAKIYRVLTPCDIRAAEAAKKAIGIVARAFRVPPTTLVAETRGGRSIVLARQLAAYLCAVSLGGVSATRTARAMRLHRSTIDHALRAIEDRRDDPVFDERLSRMEMRLQALTYKSTIALRKRRLNKDDRVAAAEVVMQL